GIINAWLYLPDLSYVTRSTYGAWLAVKIVLVFSLVALAAYNGLVTGPKLRRTRAVLPRFRLSLLLESIAGFTVLAASQRLAHQPPVYEYSMMSHPGFTGRFTMATIGPGTVLGLALAACGLMLAARRWGKSRP